MARRLDDWIKHYLKYTEFQESPEELHFWTAVATIAAAMKRKVFMDQVFFQWVPNFYIIIVAPPGIAGKSTSIGIGERILREANVANFGPNVATWQAITLALAKVAEAVAIEHSDDPLSAKMMPMSCLSFYSSEFGSLLDANDKKMLDILTDLWDGKLTEWRKETKNSGNDTIPNPWLNIIACTTPKWMSENMGKTAIGGGFASRCIFIYADRKRRLTAYPKYQLPTGVQDLAGILASDLQDIGNMRGEMLLSPDAVEWGIKWYESHYEENHGKLGDEELTGYIARKQGHIHKLAMVLSASRNSDMTIEKDDLIFAEKMIKSTELSLSKVFNQINAAPSQDAPRRLLALVAAKKKIPRSILYRTVFHSMSKKIFDEAVSDCIEAGWLSQNQYGDTIYLIATEKLYSTLGVDASKISE